MSCSCCDPFGDTDNSDFDSDCEISEVLPIDEKLTKILNFVKFLQANGIKVDDKDAKYKETYEVFFSKEKYVLSIKNVEDIQRLIVADKAKEPHTRLKEYIEKNVK